MSAAEPFGYYKDENGVKQPIPDQLKALEQAKFYMKSGCTMRAARDWLVMKTGREISTPGLLKAIRYDKNKKL